MASLRLLLFDMDGVLVDVSGSYRQAIVETVYHFTGRDVTAAQIQRYKDRGGYNDDWRLAHALIDDAGMGVSFPRVVAEFQRRYRGPAWNGLIATETPLVDTATLDRLRARYLLGIVTGRPEAEARHALRTMGWTAYLPLLVPLEKQDGRGKPDPFPLQQALTMLAAAGVRVAPNETAYVGDLGDDMEAAHRAGMWAVGHVPPYLPETHAETLADRGAHCVVTSLADLDTALKALQAADPAAVA